MEKVWLKNYEGGIPSDIGELKYESLVEYIDSSCKKFAESISFINLGKGITFRELHDLSEKFALFLRHELKLKKGDRFAIMMPNLLQYPIAMIGALKAGLSVVNVNPLYTADELKFQLKDSDTHTLLVASNFAHTVEKVHRTWPLKHIILTDIPELMSPIKRFLINFALKYVSKMVPKHGIKDYWTLKGAIKAGEQHAGKGFPEISRTDTAFLQYTGGTTGVAKAAILSHQNILANIEQSMQWMKNHAEVGKELLVTPLPLYHIFSLTVNCMIFIGLGSRNIIITNPRDTKRFIKTMKNAGITAMSGVNTLFNALVNDPSFKEVDFSKYKMTLGGGMAVQETVAHKWEAITGKPLLEAYGLTETSPAAIINPLNIDSFTGKVGLPLPSTDIMICDDDGNELGFNTPGEIYIKGPQVMQGYWNRPVETAKVFKNGWLKTGDIATVNEEGFVTIVDRKKDMILVSGFNVYPNQVEEVIVSCSGVLEVGVIGEKQADGPNEMVVAYVVRSNESLTQETIIAHAKRSLTSYKLPKKIIFIDELPKTNVGKISRKALKELHQIKNAS